MADQGASTAVEVRNAIKVYGTGDHAVTALNDVSLEAAENDYTGVDAAGRLRALDMTCPFNNVAPCPALSVPSGWTASGLPTGLQIVGRRFDDAMVLRIGAAVEDLRPWSVRTPPVPG